jgi:predicted DNA-binding transcriptional regulator YafY
VLLVVLAKERRDDGLTARKLRELFGVSRDTIRRWIRMFREEIPTSPWWSRCRGQLGAEVRDDALPGSLLDAFRVTGQGEEAALVACLRFLAIARESPAGPAG